MAAAAAEGADEGLWVRADIQTAGRGRRGRPWASLPGNLAASTIIRIRASDPPSQQIAFVAALALDSALQGWVEQRRLQLKWPNDVLLDGRKAVGILLERQSDALVVGFGVNLAARPDVSERPAISLAETGIEPPSPQSFLMALAEKWATEVAAWRAHGFAHVRARWQDRAHPPGTRLVARLGDGDEIHGSYQELDDDGALRLRLADGSTRAIHAGDVFAL